jgi:hypothetical protein
VTASAVASDSGTASPSAEASQVSTRHCQAYIYGAFHSSVRPLVLAVAAVSKAVFIGLVLSQRGRHLGHPAGVAVAVDAVMVLVFGWNLLGGLAGTCRGHSIGTLSLECPRGPARAQYRSVLEHPSTIL